MAETKKSTVDSRTLGARALSVETDYYGWLIEQAKRLRARHLPFLDWDARDAIAEELEAMAARERRELKKHLKTLLAHLLKLRGQPEELHRHRGWRTTIREAREEIEDILEDSPGIFGGKRDQVLTLCYNRARVKASDETGLPLDRFPQQCPWDIDRQILADEFFPVPSK